MAQQLQSLLAALVISLAGCASAAAQVVQSASWAQLEKEIARELRAQDTEYERIAKAHSDTADGDPNVADYGPLMGYDHFMLSPTFARVATAADERLALTMAGQFRQPLIAMAGFALIAEKYPARRFEVAAQILLAADPIQMIHGRVLLELQQLQTAEELDGVLSRVAAVLPGRQANVGIVFGGIPEELLYEWFHERSEQSVSLDLDAWILGVLYPMALSSNKPITPQMRRRLQRLRDVPGAPRATYCTYAEIGEPGFEACMGLALEDPGVDEAVLLALVYRRLAYIRENVKLDTLELPKGREDSIARMLERWGENGTTTTKDHDDGPASTRTVEPVRPQSTE